MEETDLRTLSELIRARTGWEVREADWARLREKIGGRAAVLRLPPQDYAHRLAQHPADPEWQELVALLSNSETFFFRDTGQIALLRNRVLPDLIAQRQPQRKLRLWSAGCSTGEEPYSLAILLRTLLPDHAAWDVRIVGTDVNEGSLRKARLGRYSQWSFRNAPPDLAGHFHQRGTEWELAPEVRQMVSFRTGNLLQDVFPSAVLDLCDFDLIVCRNVFIYFNRPAVGEVVRKLSASLNDGGYLLTGHAELHDQQMRDLAVRRYPESLVYQKGGAEAGKQKAEGSGQKVEGSGLKAGGRGSGFGGQGSGTEDQRPSSSSSCGRRPVRASSLIPHPSSFPTSPPPTTHHPPPNTDIRDLLRQGANRAALERAESRLGERPGSPELLCLAARAAANSGDLAKAARWCEQAREAQPFGPEPYYLLAQIAEEQGDLEKAKELLKKSVYLAPSFVPAYLELGDVYAREGDRVRADRMRANALQLLRALPENTPVEPYDAVTAGELAAQLEPLVKRKA